MDIPTLKGQAVYQCLLLSTKIPPQNSKCNFVKQMWEVVILTNTFFILYL